ncbi:RNA polymerase sigma-70 factor, ECF subfamily [Azospirillum oryzae]|uniref:RNA polymerase sigma-70 factor, ECF subfamily n=1 Tax=Azospirillum oryzae TaxID=286727 RepID=A0A1X7HRV4_9PROT|nr:sigma-70 family RNA polymerase sigma factor [Azospirillum oryzae]SMF91820.1 RNA polymerase sigma-70 factor, ECF subfamily [Azospirillum oryzae]
MIELLEPLIPALRRYARSLLRDRTAADDLVQDCLERAIAHWSQRRVGGDTRSWVFTILHNLAMTELKRRAPRSSDISVESAENWLSTPPSQEDGLHHRALLHALAALPEDQRAVILLVSIEDLSYADAAKVLDVPIGTVMSRLSRAREKLLKSIKDMPAEPAERPHLRRVK